MPGHSIISHSSGRTTAYVWISSSVLGSCVAIWAMSEIMHNWRALLHVNTKYADVLASMLIGNLYQQVGRLIMEGLCMTAGIVALVAPGESWPSSTAGAVVSWLLVAFRLMLVGNSILELLSQRVQRQHIRKGD